MIEVTKRTRIEERNSSDNDCDNDETDGSFENATRISKEKRREEKNTQK